MRKAFFICLYKNKSGRDLRNVKYIVCNDKISKFIKIIMGYYR